MPIIFCRLLDIGVSQIVETVVLQPRLLQNVLKEFVDVGLGIVLPIGIGEHQIREPQIIPQIACCLLLLLLPLLMLTQGFHHERRGSQRPGLSVFQGVESEILFDPPGRTKLLLHIDQPFVEVHTVPGQAAKLTGTHSGEQCGHNQCFMLMTFHSFKQFGDFGRIKGLNLRLIDLGQDARFRWILGDVSDLHRNRQRLVQAAVGVLPPTVPYAGSRGRS